MIVFYIFITFGIVGFSTQKECRQRDYGNGGTVCVCDSNYCDTLEKITPTNNDTFVSYTSSQEGLRFEKASYKFGKKANYDNVIKIDRYQTFQNIFGWGGSFTDSTGINILNLPESAQELLIRSYFGEDGLEYNLCRVPIGGTDFSTYGYSYDDYGIDPSLHNFELQDPDFKYKIPLMKNALSLEKELKFFAAAWTAPKWMKTNNEYYGLATIKAEYHQTWADYFVKFLESYQAQHIEFWGISSGNEPANVLIPGVEINSVGWTPKNLLQWITQHLGPTLKNSSFYKIKLMTIDDQRFFAPIFIDAFNNNKQALNYVDGIALHWYADKIVPANYLTEFHNAFPEKFILGTEACSGFLPMEKHVSLGSWKRGEDYASSIIEDTNNWSIGWVDWNMALNLQGGPTYINNFVDSPIIVNSTSGEFYKQPMYYALGHFSKFVVRNSTRIYSTQLNNNVPNVALKRPDNGTVLIILNKLYHNFQISIEDKSRGFINVELPQKSITTIIYW